MRDYIFLSVLSKNIPLFHYMLMLLHFHFEIEYDVGGMVPT